jgi:DNA-binding NarL/FixJ family response regulator
VPATSLVREHHPHVHVVVVIGDDDSFSPRQAVQAGAEACLLDSIHPDDLASAIRSVVLGRSMFSLEILPQLTRQTQGDDLTARERDVIALIADGRTNNEIADALGLSRQTIRVYVSTILTKLGVTNRTQAAVLALRTGLAGPTPPAPAPRRNGSTGPSQP